MPIPTTTIEELIAKYEVLLFDAYGVLVHQKGPFPGARELIFYLNKQQKNYFVLTNDASRMPQTIAQKFAQMGLKIATEKIITAGSLLKPYFIKNNFHGMRCVVLGPEDCFGYVKEAGGKVVALDETGHNIDALIICDEMGYPFLESIDSALSMLFNKIDRLEDIQLILPNPDFIYPKGKNSFGITSGSIAMILEQALHIRYPEKKLTFVSLGKPNEQIYNCAFELTQSKQMIMIGDQIQTDIKGANKFGMDSVLVTTGVNKPENIQLGPIKPTYFLSTLAFSQL